MNESLGYDMMGMNPGDMIQYTCTLCIHDGSESYECDTCIVA